MRRSALLWILALVLTLTAVIWQRRTGPTYPLGFDQEYCLQRFSGELLRSHSTNEAMPVRVRAVAADCECAGGTGTQTFVPMAVFWRRFPTDDPWQRLAMTSAGEELVARIPAQPPAGKVEYYLAGIDCHDPYRIPADEAVVARFKGDVPAAVLAVHILMMFGGMLLAVRAGLEALSLGPALRRQAWLTLGLLTVGGLILGPVVQKYAFGAYWTGWPLGEDLTDNKLAVSVLAWVIAVWRLRGYEPVQARGRWFALAAMVVVLGVYAIPHSLHGSALDYTTMEHVQG